MILSNLRDPRSQTQFGNALVIETQFRNVGNRVVGTLSFPNRVWEREIKAYASNDFSDLRHPISDL